MLQIVVLLLLLLLLKQQLKRIKSSLQFETLNK